jgi:ATP-dependent exoDNAse (exonuclease V) alpha subunit
MPGPVNEALDRRQRPQPASGRPSEVLAGFVDRVTFHNAENGFCVLRIKARGQRDPITVIWHAAMISAGEFVQASGRWINDRTHGVQFRASFLKATPPTTIEGIEKYLGSGMIRGIGPVYAKKLVRAFGEAVFDVIAQEPGRLREVSGIGPKRAERIIAGWADFYCASLRVYPRHDLERRVSSGQLSRKSTRRKAALGACPRRLR